MEWCVFWWLAAVVGLAHVARLFDAMPRILDKRRMLMDLFPPLCMACVCVYIYNAFHMVLTRTHTHGRKVTQCSILSK